MLRFRLGYNLCSKNFSIGHEAEKMDKNSCHETEWFHVFSVFFI